MREICGLRMKQGVAVALVAGLVMGAVPSLARAAVDGDVRAGLYPDADAVAIGAGVLTPVGSSSEWYFNPNVEVAMGDSRDIVAMSGDFHYDFAANRSTSFWMGAGPALLVVNRDGVDRSDTDLGVNVLTGLGAKRGNVRPFAQLRGTVADDSQVAITGGIRF